MLRGEKVGEFSFTLSENLTGDDIKFLNFSLGVPETYKYVVELGNVSNITIELTEPATSECTCVCACSSANLPHVYLCMNSTWLLVNLLEVCSNKLVTSINCLW